MTKLCLTTAAVLLTSIAGASAAGWETDANTGLHAGIYYGPIHEHMAKGHPVSEAGKKWARDHGHAPRVGAAPTRAARASTGTGQILLLENRPGPDRVITVHDKHWPW